MAICYHQLRKSTKQNQIVHIKFFSCRSGLVLGVYEGCAGLPALSPTACRVDEDLCGKLSDFIRRTDVKKGKAFLVTNLPNTEFDAVALTGVGREDAGFNFCENLDQCKENIRAAVGKATKALQAVHIDNITVEGFSSPQAAAEGAALAVYSYQEYLNKKKRRKSTVEPHHTANRSEWDQGILMAEAQNIARELEDMPANILTPYAFTQKAAEIVCPCGVTIKVHPAESLCKLKFNSLLAVGKGSCNPPAVLEICYSGGTPEERPIALVGNGVTFNTGGLCLRSCRRMLNSRAEMAGGAVVLSVIKAAAQLNLPININGVIPLCEVATGLTSVKPGDVLLGMNCKTIEVEDTSKIGQIIASDAMCYAGYNYRPCLICSVATLTRGILAALGSSASGVFTNSEIVWEALNKAGADTGDRVWRMPLWEYFKPRITDTPAADLTNVGKGEGGEPCVGAAFLMEFMNEGDFLHLDITGTGMVSSGLGHTYLPEGSATGRPTRTLVEFLLRVACPNIEYSTCETPSAD